MANTENSVPHRSLGSSEQCDLSEHVQALQALEASESRFRTFVDHAMDAFFLFDDQLIVVDVNRQACEALGYTRDEILGMHPKEFDASLTEAAIEVLRQRNAAGETITFETQHRRKDGTEFPVEIRSRRFEQNGRSFMLALARDISERKRAEAERLAYIWFLESMDRISRATQGAEDVETMIRAVLAVVLEVFACDRAWLHDTGATPEARVLVEITRPEYPGPAALGIRDRMPPTIVRELAATQALTGPVIYGPGGRTVPAPGLELWSIRSQMLMFIRLNNEGPYVFGLHQCSYARVWSEQERRLFQATGDRLSDAISKLLTIRSLRESEHRLDEAQRIAQVGYWDRDLDSGVLTLSEQACRIFGVPAESRVMDLTKWHAQWQELIHPEDRERIVEASDAALKANSIYDVEYRIVRPGGEVRIIHSRGEVRRDDSGHARRMFGMMQDITELRQAEEDRKRAESALQLAQAELTHVMRVTSLEGLAASIAHEVNQPLNAMVMSAAACRRWLSVQPPQMAKARRALARVMKAGKGAGAVIDRVRALAKRQAPRSEPVDINETIREVIALTQYELRRNEIVLERRLAENLPALRGDKVQLQQVLLNLITNAIEAMNAVQDRRRTLKIVSSMDGVQSVRVEVHDSGHGLQPETAARLFEPFYSTKPKGLGIGLSLCSSIVEAHGGVLSAESRAPHGAVFRFSLPLEAPATAQAPDP